MLEEVPGLDHNYMLGYNSCQLYDESIYNITASLTKAQEYIFHSEIQEICLVSSNSQCDFWKLWIKMEAYRIRRLTGTLFWWIVPESIRSKNLIAHFWKRGFYILRNFLPNVGLIKPEKAHFSAGLELLDKGKQCCSIMRFHYYVGKIPLLAVVGRTPG